MNLPKCCGKSEQLKTDLKSCVNMNEDYNGFYPEDIVFLSSKTMKPIPNVNETDILVRYNSKPKCNGIEIVPLTESVMLLDNGSILIIEDKDNFTFQSDSYCVERVLIDRSRAMYRTAPSDHTFVVLLCPCTSRVCARKCCFSGGMLNIQLHDSNIQADCIDYKWRPGLEDNFVGNVQNSFINRITCRIHTVFWGFFKNQTNKKYIIIYNTSFYKAILSFGI